MEVILLYKKIEGNLTSEEEKIVDEWLKASPQHRAYFERLKTHYFERNDFVPLPETLSRYRENYNQVVAEKFRRKRWSGYTAALLVASILVIISVAAIMFFSPVDNMTPATPAIAEKEITVLPEIIDSVPVYTEKKTNGKIILAIGGNTKYGLSEISERQVENVEYDAAKKVVTYKHSTSSQPAEIHKLSTAPGAELCVCMEDGTTIWLNSNTEIEYPSRFDGNVRNVKLKGEAYFEVHTDSLRPFIVSTGEVNVRVYGTQFNVNTRRHNTVSTTLVEGSVALIPQDSDKEVFLTPGETGKYNDTTGKIKVTEEDLDLYIGWRKGAYHFSDTSLHDLFEEISGWYGIDVTFANEAICKEKFSGIISRKMPLNDLLNILEQTNYVDFKLNGKQLIIKDKN